MPEIPTLNQLNSLNKPDGGGDPSEIALGELNRLGLGKNDFATLSQAIMSRPEVRAFDNTVFDLLERQTNGKRTFGYAEFLRMDGIEKGYVILRDKYDYVIVDVSSKVPKIPHPLYLRYHDFVTDIIEKIKNGGIQKVGFTRIASFKVRGLEVVVLRGPRGRESLSTDPAVSIVVSSSQAGFPKEALNDLKIAAWGSKEEDSDVFAVYVFPRPVCVETIGIRLMEAHLKDVRVIAANDIGQNPLLWEEIPSRLAESGAAYTINLSTPSGPDDYQVIIEPEKMAVSQPFRGIGLICKRSKGDVCNYHPQVGSGMYMHELEIFGTVAQGNACHSRK